MKATLGELATAIGGTTNEPELSVDGASQDSRSIGSGMLFVPLVAERDGHDFISGARERGATGYLTSNGVDGQGPGALHVRDTSLALRAIGQWARRKLAGPVVGITGSVGKTSTKDVLEALLGGSFNVHASEKSFNNEIGVPLTLFNAPDSTEATIVEMGARGLGHIALLCSIAQPSIGVVTTVAPAHTGEFGSLESIAQAKGELVASLPSSGLAVLNADVDLVLAMKERTSARCLTFGKAANADVRVDHVETASDLSLTIELSSPAGPLTLRPALRGAHLAGNVAAAVAVALELGVSVDEIEERVGLVTMSPWRMELSASATGAAIINDAYNANPASMRGAIEALGAMAQRRKVAVLGYMAELGPDEGAAHEAIARLAESMGIEVVPVGTDLYGIEATDAPATVIGSLGVDSAVLVKGSRSAGLEVVAAELLDH